MDRPPSFPSRRHHHANPSSFHRSLYGRQRDMAYSHDMTVTMGQSAPNLGVGTSSHFSSHYGSSSQTVNSSAHPTAFETRGFHPPAFAYSLQPPQYQVHEANYRSNAHFSHTHARDSGLNANDSTPFTGGDRTLASVEMVDHDMSAPYDDLEQVNSIDSIQSTPHFLDWAGESRTLGPTGLRFSSQLHSAPSDRQTNVRIDEDSTDQFYPDEPLSAEDERRIQTRAPGYSDFSYEHFNMLIPETNPLNFEHGHSRIHDGRNLAEYTIFDSEDAAWSMSPDKLWRAAFERNLSFYHFMKQWLVRYRLSRSQLELPTLLSGAGFPPILEEAANVGHWRRPTEIRWKDVRGESCDVQGINWHLFGVSRSTARKLRDSMYVPYRNMRNIDPNPGAMRLPEVNHSFCFNRIQTKIKPRLAHFQLRNLMSAVNKNCIAWVGENIVNCTDPDTGHTSAIIRLSDTRNNNLVAPVRISAMKASHGVVVAGGFDGEYAMHGLGLESGPPNQVSGVLTTNKEAITNYVEICLNRSNASPQTVFSSNDSVVRVYDVQANSCVSTQPYEFAVNCTATSPDGRLRLLVGDTPEALIVDADKGAPQESYLQSLSGHSDHGFACAWSPCGRQIATGNQDGTIQIFDTRTWRRLALIGCDVAGYRSLAFSPVGGGSRVLAAAEPADRVTLIDAQTYQTRQTHDFFGEIGGIDFLPDGSNLVVANMDKRVGGLMWYERIGYGESKGLRKTKKRAIIETGFEWREEEPDEWLWEEELDADERVLLCAEERKRRGLGPLLEGLIL